MPTLSIENLPRIRELDRAARAAIRGGQGYPMPASIAVGEPNPGMPSMPSMPPMPAMPSMPNVPDLVKGYLEQYHVIPGDPPKITPL